MADSKVYTPIGGRSGSGGRGGRGGRGQNPVALNPELGERERERGLQRRWEEKGIGSAVDAGTATMPSGPSATDVSSPAFSSTPEPPPILNGSPVSATGSALTKGLAFPSLYFYNGGVREFLATIKQQVFIARGLRAATKKQKYDKICEKKLSTPIEVLRKSHPVDFASYFHYCHSLTFDQRPDYGFLKRLFHDLFTREGKTLYWKRNDEAEAATNVGTFELINFKEIPKGAFRDYREHNDDTTVHFEVIMSEENLIMAKQEGLLKKFKLTTTISTSNMHLFDPKGVIKKYETPEQILEEFFHESEVICVVLNENGREDTTSTFELVRCKLTLFYNYWQMNEILEALLPNSMIVPSAFETVGHITHLNLRDEHLPYKKLIAKVVLDKNKPKIQTVVNKIDAIHNDYRTMQLEVLAGNHSLVTIVVENGLRFHVDLATVYWNSRLATERQRLLNCFTCYDVICDVFAGVGPIAISAGRKVKHVFANDLNPFAVEYLERNCVLNELERKIEYLDG
ncbi:unnamed protein product [Camellia sinensis]